MDFKALQLQEMPEDQHQDPNSKMKIKLLDELIEKIMSMDDGSKEESETPQMESSESPALELKEKLGGEEMPTTSDSLMKDKLASLRGT